MLKRKDIALLEAVRRIARNLKILLSKDIEPSFQDSTREIKHDLEKQRKYISQLSDENLFLFRALFDQTQNDEIFGEDVWLKEAKDKHKGERCFILATGPSLNKIDLSKIKGEVIFGVNGIYKIAQEIELMYFVYVSNWYWKHHKEGIRNVKCYRRFIPKHIPDLSSDIPTSWLNVLLPRYYTFNEYKLPVPASFSYYPNKYIFAGGTVLYLCFQLAFYMGFKTVIMLGLDHSYRKGEDHFAKKHGGIVFKSATQNMEHFDKAYIPSDVCYHVDLNAMEQCYLMAETIFTNDGREILNASPGTHLDIFKKIEYEKLF